MDLFSLSLNQANTYISTLFQSLPVALYPVASGDFELGVGLVVANMVVGIWSGGPRFSVRPQILTYLYLLFVVFLGV